MPKISEETLNNWRRPPSTTEESKLSNAERMVKEAINEDDTLKSKTIDVFGQGSYANDTNVRLNSDIDINLCYEGGFYYDLPENVSKEDAGLGNPINYSFSEFKDDVENALVNKFRRSEVKRKKKCITILGNSYRVETDVVPTWKYRRYSSASRYVTGVYFQSDDGEWIDNYPKQHIANGKDKNADTHRRFKRLTRIHRKLRYKMIEDGENIDDGITSFLLECLVWNVPNSIFNNNDTWTDRLKDSVIHIYQKTKDIKDCKEWGEVSELLYLYYGGRKWSRKKVNEYMVQAWNYLEFK